jgi:hypothetical protein
VEQRANTNPRALPATARAANSRHQRPKGRKAEEEGEGEEAIETYEKKRGRSHAVEKGKTRNERKARELAKAKEKRKTRKERMQL